MAQECAWTKGRIELHTVIVHYSSAALTKQKTKQKQLKRDECKRIREDNRSTHKTKVSGPPFLCAFRTAGCDC